VLQALHGGVVLELGAGTGRMAAAVLSTLASLDALPERYFILEVSADLRERQRTRIEALPAELRDRVVWLDSLPAAPIRGVILANEVLDALPCQRVVIRGGEVQALGVAVALETGQFVERDGPINSEVAEGLPRELADGYTTEICPRIGPWIASLGDCLASGLALFFDYGLPRAHYYHPQRCNGTLRCHFKQRAHDNPFINVGVQDITAWVDFTRVAEAADSAGLQVSGFATQAAFLLGLGIESMVTNVRLASEARQLLMPGEMGEVFKAMALTRGFDEPLAGFSVQDLRHTL
jgi:SAM-dependent MidA family methyltransferase